MKKILMFTMAGCPHCRNAKIFIEDELKKHPEYKAVEMEVIDEVEHPNIANSYDYYYVPTFYLDNVKFHEGVPSREMISELFKKAYEG